MKSLVTLLLTLIMLISPFAIQAGDSAELTSDGTESEDTESSRVESGNKDDGTGDGKTREEEEPDCD